MKQYKNISKQDLILIGIGIIKSGEIIKTKQDINNPNFVLVGNYSKRTQISVIKRRKYKK